MKKQATAKGRQPLADGLRVDKALRIVWQAAPRWTVASTVLVMIQAVVPLITLFILKLVVDRLTNAHALPRVGANFEDLAILLGAAFLTAMVGNLCNAVLAHVNTIQAHFVADHIQGMVQSKSLEVDLAYYENSQYYDALYRAQREAPSRPVQIVHGLTQLARNSLTLLGAFAMLLLFHWTVVLAVFVASVPVLYYRLKQAEAIYTLHRDKTASERLGAYFNRVITTAEDAKEVRIFGFGPVMADRFRELRDRIRTALRQISAQGSRRQFITETTAALAGYGSLAFIVRSAMHGSISLGELVMYFGAFQVAMGALRPTLGSLAEVYENNLFLSALYEFLAVPKSITEPVNPQSIPRPWRSGVKVENLSFRYPGTEHLVLEAIDMFIGAGETVALVGRNGSGKTTLAKLLCRLYDPVVGRITIDGIDFRDFCIEDLRREIGVIYQDFGRYHLTARENIQLGRPQLNPFDPAIVATARLAGIHDDLMRLSQGYDTVLSRSLADGEELSVGQWQKLALARALLRDSQLILLDEPTSSLDPAAEFEFFEKFRMIVRERSVLVISHRFSTVRLADRIYVLEAGRVVEQGNHDALIAANGLYASLYRKQASYYGNVATASNCDNSTFANAGLS